VHTTATRALIAEDDALVAEVITAELEKIGVQVVGKASDGQQAIALTESLRPDVVLMDINMPEMDGLEAARRIQQQCPTPVIVLTVHSVPEMVREAADAGVGAYLIKPPKGHELERAITIARARFADLVELRRLNAELQDALAKVKMLSGMLPICASCKKIRDDQGYWQQVEVYIRDHSEAELSHGICPECMEILYPRESYPYLYRKEQGQES
jgi:AmiR/NasT family two-component response regulator